MTTQIDDLSQLIDDAAHVPLPHHEHADPHLVDLSLPHPRSEIRVPEATVTMLQDYELYVG